jgi:hypothetical protein
LPVRDSGAQFFLPADRLFIRYPVSRKYLAGVMPVSRLNAATNALADS